MNNNLIVKRFSVCVPVKGFARSMIYDLNRSEFQFVPNDLIEYLDFIEGKTLEQIQSYNQEQSVENFSDYLHFLFENEYIFTCKQEEESFFPALNTNWKDPAKFTNAIIELGIEKSFDLEKCLGKLDEAGCKYLLFFSKDCLKIADYKVIADQLYSLGIRQVNFITKYDASVNLKELTDLIISSGKISNILFHSTPETQILYEFQNTPIILGFKDTAQEVLSPKVDYSYFEVNIQLFTESQAHHSYFNRKICIDVNGSVKNSLLQKKSFGHIDEVDLNQVYLDAEFRKLWTIPKDNIDICKNCEFRYACIDNRIPKQRKDGSYYHESECNYNPYIAKWAGESGYVSLSTLKITSDQSNFNADHAAIEEKLQELYATT